MKWVVKRSSRTIGAVYELSNGDLCYLARRWRGEIFCCGEPNISAAMALNKEEWAFDHDHLLEFRLKKVKYVGVIERERGGMIYITTLETCMDPTKFTFRNYEKRGGAMQHYVNHKHFIKLAGKTTF
ncbi:hypothetical protein SAMN05216358_0132 [Rhizobium sp. AN5]|nr:hypothetical protein SAMN05216358_0132 [Rhizobium sp. AN5]